MTAESNDQAIHVDPDPAVNPAADTVVDTVVDMAARYAYLREQIVAAGIELLNDEQLLAELAAR